MTGTALGLLALSGLAMMGIAWLIESASVGSAGAVVWSLPFARLLADRAARGVRS